jgi:hypothetical protein
MKNYYAKNGLCSAGGLALTAFLSWAGVFLASLVLDARVQPPPGVESSNWVSQYSSAEMLPIVAWSCLTAVFWHAIALLNPGRHADLRPWWYGLWAAAIAGGIVVPIALTPAAQSGTEGAYVLALLATGFGFWAGTVWCSPATSKYVPVGSRYLRRW